MGNWILYIAAWFHARAPILDRRTKRPDPAEAGDSLVLGGRETADWRLRFGPSFDGGMNPTFFETVTPHVGPGVFPEMGLKFPVPLSRELGVKRLKLLAN